MRMALCVCVLAFPLACAQADDNVVEMTAGPPAFVPEEITVEAGATVTFVVSDREAHTVTAYEERLPRGTPFFSSGAFESEQQARSDLARGLLTDGETYEVTFERPGVYEYFCIPHEDQGMRGTVVVR